MPRPRKPENERKNTITFRLKQSLIDKIKETPKYNAAVEKVLEENFNDKK